MTATERSPLLKSGDINTNYNDNAVVQNENAGEISVIPSAGSDDTQEGQEEEVRKSRLNGSSLLVILFGLQVGVFLAALDSSIVATIYPQIGTEFKRSNEIIWIATAYMLSYTALQPLYGRISDTFGRRSALLFAIALFFIGSAMCGASSNLWALVFSRVIAGIGGGGLNSMSSIITSDLVSLRERGKYQGYTNIAFGLGSLIGGPIGGFLTDSFGWRFCFYINLPLLVLSLYVAIRVITNYNLKEQDLESTIWDRMKKIDYLGSISVVVCVVCFSLAASMGGNSRPWSDPLVLGLFIASFIMGFLFLYIEKHVAKNPLMPWSIISSRTPFASSLLNFFCMMSSFAVSYTTPLYFQGLLGYSASMSGLYILPRVIAASVGSLTAGFWISRVGEYRKLLIVSAITNVISTAGASLWGRDTSFWFISFCFTLDGWAGGCIITAALISMLSCVGSEDMATITSMSYLFRSCGGVLGISGASAIFQSVIKSDLTKRITGPDAEEIIEIARKSMNEIRDLLPPDSLAIVLESYELAIQYSFIFCVVVTLCALLSSLFIQQFHLLSKKSNL